MHQKSSFRSALSALAVSAVALLSACAETGTGDDFLKSSGQGGGGTGTYSGGVSSGGGNGGGGGSEKAEPDLTSGQQNALGSAQDYISMSGFSRSGLIKQLKFEGYNAKNAAFAVDYLHIDWDEQAARSAKDYISMSGFSRSGLVQQLEFEGYTSQQAEYGAKKALGGGGGSGKKSGSGLTSGQANALKSAEDYISMSGFSRSGLIQQLEFEGYSSNDATVAVDLLKVNWNEQAVRSAKDYVSMSGFSRSGLIEQLMFEGYTAEQAEYGADRAL